MDPSPDYERPAGTQGLGSVVWPPPTFILERSLAFRRRFLRLATSLQFAGVAVAALGAFAVQAGFDAGWGLAGVGLLLLFASVWPRARAARARTVWLAVFEEGVVMPSSFTSLPGLSKFGGPCVLPRIQITSAREIRRGGERAVVVMREDGQGGIVSARVGEVGLSPAECEQTLDGFVAALAGCGVEVRPDGSDVGAEPAPP